MTDEQSVPTPPMLPTLPTPPSPSTPMSIAIGTRSPDETRLWDGKSWSRLDPAPTGAQATAPSAQASLPIGTHSPDGSRFWDGQTWARVGSDSPLPPQNERVATQPAPALAVGTRSPDGGRVWDGQRWRLVGPDSPFAPSAGQTEPPAISQIRIGRRGKIVAAAVAVLVLIGIAGNVLLNNITTPEAVASDYLSAVGSNNADGIWADSMLTAGQTAYYGSGAYSLATKDELKAMLNLPENKHSSRDSINVTQLADYGTGNVVVSAQYNEAGHPVSEQLGLTRSTNDKKFGFYPYWKVVVVPGYLGFTGAPDGAVLSVDGIGIPAGTATVATYPGTHQVTAGATTIFAADTEKVTAASNQGAQATFKTQLTSAAKNQATQALKTAFAACAQATTPSAQNCPQNFYGLQGTATWTLVGDPTSGLQLAVTPTYTNSVVLVADGHFMMTFAYASSGTPSTTGHRFSGGPYEATFAVSGNSLSLSGLGSGGQAPPMPAPSDASDTAIKTAVLAALKGCAAITLPSSEDCPQGIPSYQSNNPTNVHWTLVGDPTASGVQIAWDGNIGAYTVTGNLDMKVTYDDPSAGPQAPPDATGQYVAHVLWTEGVAQVVWIEGR
jgi:hypothetical protein